MSWQDYRQTALLCLGVVLENNFFDDNPEMHDLFHYDEYLTDIQVGEDWARVKAARWLERDLERKIACAVCLEAFNDTTVNCCLQCEAQWCRDCNRRLALKQIILQGAESVARLKSGEEVEFTQICPCCRHERSNRMVMKK